MTAKDGIRPCTFLNLQLVLEVLLRKGLSSLPGRTRTDFSIACLLEEVLAIRILQLFRVVASCRRDCFPLRSPVGKKWIFSILMIMMMMAATATTISSREAESGKFSATGLLAQDGTAEFSIAFGLISLETPLRTPFMMKSTSRACSTRNSELLASAIP